MEKISPTGITTSNQQTRNYVYPLMNLSLLIVLPVLSIFCEAFIDQIPFHWSMPGKWFIFWSVGVRLFVAGVKQASNPEYTATQIFRMKGTDSHIIIRELGFANISLGAMGILSVINEQWRLIAAITAGLFFGLAAMQHSMRKPASRNELIALLYDSMVFIGLMVYLLFELFF